MEQYRKHVKADCEELLSRFQTTESVRFEIFSRTWREMNFSEIFYGTVNHEKRSFSRLALDVAFAFLLPPFSFQIRVGGLYLLYSLYRTQTASPPEQIRVALKDWADVKKFEKDCAEAQHFDVVFVLRQLVTLKAFHFTAMPTQLTYNKKRKAKRSTVCEQFIERPSRPQELVNTELLDELSNVHKLYEKLKTSACSATEGGATSVHLIHKDLVPQLRGAVMEFYKWQQRKDAPDEDGGEGTSSFQQECSGRAVRLASIKSKAYTLAAEAPKSRRHRQVEVDFTSSEAGPSSGAPGHSRTSKPSLRARTNENVRISGDVWKEAMSTTLISRLTSLDPATAEKNKKLKKGNS